MENQQGDMMMINALTAKEYMKQKVQPVMSKLLESLVVEQPDNVLEFIAAFAKKEQTKKYVCEMSGLEADIKVRKKDGTIAYYVDNVYQAMKRKGKLRGSVSCGIDEELPDIEKLEREEKEMFENNMQNIDTSAYTSLEDRPVTPPDRGFEMTRPGENYHNGPSISNHKNSEKKPPRTLSFEPQVLGGSKGNMKDMTEEERKQAIVEAAKKRQDEAPKLGSEHLLSKKQREELIEKRRKDDLLGRIRGHYANIGAVEPFGLAAASIPILEKHLEKCKAQVKSVSQQQAKQNKIETMAKQIVSGPSEGKSEDDVTEEKSRRLNFPPRALGVAEAKELTPEERRERIAKAAADRFSKKR